MQKLWYSWCPLALLQYYGSTKESKYEQKNTEAETINWVYKYASQYSKCFLLFFRDNSHEYQTLFYLKKNNKKTLDCADDGMPSQNPHALC